VKLFCTILYKNRALNAQCFETFGIVGNGPNIELEQEQQADRQAGRQAGNMQVELALLAINLKR